MKAAPTSKIPFAEKRKIRLIAADSRKRRRVMGDVVIKSS